MQSLQRSKSGDYQALHAGRIVQILDFIILMNVG